MEKRSSLEQVKEFHEAFGHPVRSTPSYQDKVLRYDLLEEELQELKEALWNNDDVETFDALCDLQYVLDGAFLALGFHRYKEAGMQEVHRSNMSKLGEDGQPIRREDGKILKSALYSPPDLEKILNV